MESFAWIIYGLFLIGPYVIVFAALFLAAFLLPKFAFAHNRRFGIVVLIATAISIGFVAIKYMVLEPREFNNACASGIGLQVSKSVKADSYTLDYVENFGDGHLNHTDATIKAAIAKVAFKNVDFVEIQDSPKPGPYYNVLDSLKQYSTPSQKPGYFKVLRSTVGSGRCRWLLPEDVKPLNYDTYMSYQLESEKNVALRSEDQTKECIAVEYIDTSTSKYLVSFYLEEKLSKNVVKHEIRVIDQSANGALVGRDVVYEYISGVFGSAAFWLSNGKMHHRCPVNSFENRVVGEILGF